LENLIRSRDGCFHEVRITSVIPTGKAVQLPRRWRAGGGLLKRDCLVAQTKLLIRIPAWKSSQSRRALDYDEVSAASNKEKP
jgi:hypothetical protein